jgi:uncharacterized protein YecE (DUF72 family)
LLSNSGAIEDRVRVGTCGWSYKDDWRDVFYPPWLPEKFFLEYYASVFNTNEIDSSFYYIPRKEYVQLWVDKTPPNFLFSAKMPQDLTHKAKLDLEKGKDALNAHCISFSPMEITGKMIAHLVQLPPKFTYDEHYEVLEAFLNHWNDWRASEGVELLNGTINSNNWQLVVEFRHQSWMNECVFDLLRENKVAYCAVIEPTLPPRMDITNPALFYLRFHGFGQKIWFDYLFSPQEINKWAGELKKIIHSNPKTRVVAYFNNHFSGNAVKNAKDLLPEIGLPDAPDMESINSRFKSLLKRKKTTKTESGLDRWLELKGADK